MAAVAFSGRWLFLLWRAWVHHTLQPCFNAKELCTPATFKLGRGGTAGKMPPFASNSCSFCGINLHLRNVGHNGGFYLGCGVDSMQCHELLDTGSTISLIQCELRPSMDATHLPSADLGMLRITTVTGQQAIILGKRTVHGTMGSTAYTHDFFFMENIQDICIIGLDLLEKWGAVLDVAKGKLAVNFGVVSLCSPDWLPLPFPTQACEVGNRLCGEISKP